MQKHIILLSFLIILSSCINTEVQNSEESIIEQQIEQQVEELLSKMSLDEKIGQTALRGTSSRVKGELPEELKEAVRKGEIGAFLNVMKPEYVDELQKIAVEDSPNGIPLIFARDIIHGFKTIFPIPLGLAATWDKHSAETSARVSAIEAAENGIRWTFSPMLDIARDARWGRIAESPGEDPYLASILAEAYIKGYQGEDLKSYNSMIACSKHFIAYGAAEGGRDYNQAIVNEELLRNVYLPPFNASFKAGAQTVMTSFNDINGVPASGNKFILKQVLRDELNFDGFVVSDWNSVTEMITHGYAEDEKHSAERAFNAGLDMEMTSGAYDNNIKALLDEGKIKEKNLDEFVRNILRVKLRMGLFDKPFRNKEVSSSWYSAEHLASAKDAAVKSMVLLKNKDILPLRKSQKIALIGPLADAPLDQLGTWCFDGDKDHSITPFLDFKKNGVNMNFTKGLDYSRDKSKKGFDEAIKLAKQSDVIVFIGGEEAILSGEAHSRADIGLPGAQEELLLKLKETGKPIVLVIMAGRPIALNNILDNLDGVIMAWHPGTMAGPAIHDVLYGISQPLGRLPVTWPKSGAQCPIYYNHTNTGRPASSDNFIAMDDIPVGAWQSSLGNYSHYLDLGFEPQFPFGFGLNYGKVEYEKTSVSSEQINRDDEITVTAKIVNTGKTEVNELVQLYVQDVVGDIVRPVRELKGFQRVRINSGASLEVRFKLSIEELKYYNSEMKYDVEDGKFNVWIAPNSAEGIKASFELVSTKK